MEPTNRYPYRRKLVITVRSFPLLMVWPWIGRPRCTPSNNEIVFILVYLQWILLLSKPPLAEDKPLHPLLRLVSTKNTASMMRSISKDYISKSLIDKQNIQFKYGKLDYNCSFRYVCLLYCMMNSDTKRSACFSTHEIS